MTMNGTAIAPIVRRRRALSVVLTLLLLGLAAALAMRAAGDGSRAGVMRRLALRSVPSALAVDAATGHVFVGSIEASTVSVLDERSGEVLRTVSLPLFGGSGSLAVDASAGRIYAASEEAVALLDARTGLVTATAHVGSSPGTIAVDPRAGRVVVSALFDNTITVLDAVRGARLHTVRTGQRPVGVALDPTTDLAYVCNSGDGSISVVDTRTGTAVTTVKVGGYPVLAAVDSMAGRVVVGYSAGQQGNGGATARSPGINMLDTHAFMATTLTGQSWSRAHRPLTRASRAILATIGQSVVPAGASAVVVDERIGRAFVANHDAASVTVLDTRRGTLLRLVATGPLPVGLAMDKTRGRVFVIGAGTPTGLTVLDARTGARLHMLSLSGTPVALTVDETRGRVLVAMDSGQELTPDPWEWLPGWRSGGLRHLLPFLPRPGPSSHPVPPGLVIIDEARL